MKNFKIISLIIVLLFSILLLISCGGNMKGDSWKKHVDFVVDIETGRNPRILFITDTQLIDSSQMRTRDRLNPDAQIKWAPNKVESNCFYYIRDTVEITNPDLILILGDLIYGEFDDSGVSLKKLCNYMDSFEIPWAPLFGNHDNESYMGVDWQVETIENAKHSLFARGNVTGNCNYTIGISQGNKLIRTIFMMDSNGCGYTFDPKVKNDAGFGQDQLEWFEDVSRAIGKKTPKFVCFHISTSDFTDGYVEAGYLRDHGDTSLFVIGEDGILAKNGDFGAKYSSGLPGLVIPHFTDLLKANGVDGVFTGHYHRVSTSVLYRGIRFTQVLKTGVYDHHNVASLGGTYVELKENGKFSVEHKYIEAYPITEDIYSHIYMGD